MYCDTSAAELSVHLVVIGTLTLLSPECHPSFLLITVSSHTSGLSPLNWPKIDTSPQSRRQNTPDAWLRLRNFPLPNHARSNGSPRALIGRGREGGGALGKDAASQVGGTRKACLGAAVSEVRLICLGETRRA